MAPVQAMTQFIDDNRGSYGVEPICNVLPPLGSMMLDQNVTGHITTTLPNLAAAAAVPSDLAGNVGVLDEPISRNALCPCGSGKKFKHCHGAVA